MISILESDGQTTLKANDEIRSYRHRMKEPPVLPKKPVVKAKAKPVPRRTAGKLFIYLGIHMVLIYIYYKNEYQIKIKQNDRELY